MARRVAVNTGPLIALARMDLLDVAGRLPMEFICPPQVRAELDEGARLGHIPVAPAWLQVHVVREALSPVAVSSLDTGEAAVIQLALEQGISWVCMDEWKGRRATLAAGLKVVGALGLLGFAKVQGLIVEMRPYIERAVVAGIRYDAELVRQVLKAAGE
jgi:predicted nucleic acid-binding protein